MLLYDCAADRQPDPASRERIARVQALERCKDLVTVGHVQPNAVVTHNQLPQISQAFGCNANDRFLVSLAEFECVAEEILE